MRAALLRVDGTRPVQSAVRRFRFTGPQRRGLIWGIRLAALSALALWALSTPGFTSMLSILALLNAVSFIGCVAVGMTFITLSGNIMSLSLGATVSATACIFLASLGAGVITAALIAILFGTAITVAQGALVGSIRANPILVSIAALALILGMAEYLTGGQRIYPAGEGYRVLRGSIAGIPEETLVFLLTVAAGQIVLSCTRLGRAMIMVGSNARAAEVAGIQTARVVTTAYALAGASSAISGILLAARYGSGDMELGAGYDYSAIAAVLVGGTNIAGGSGSVLRTLIGATVIGVIEVVLLLRGFSEQWQYLVTGLIVLGVIMLHTLGERP